MIYHQSDRLTLFNGDSLEILKQIPSNSVHTGITSPPYFNQCDYKVEGQIGLEQTIDEFLENLCAVFREVHRILVNGGVLWVIIADTQNNYSPIRGKGERRSKDYTMRRPMQQGYREKEALQIPQKLVEAMRSDGWVFRRELIWDKGSSGQIATSDTAPLTHESVLQFGKWEGNDRPYLNCKPLRSSILRYPPVSDPVHPCPFPFGLVSELLDASMQLGETMIDPFAGRGTSLFAGQQRGHAIGVELNPDFCELIRSNALISSLSSLRSAQLGLFAD